MNKILKKYIDPAQPGSFSGLSGFLKNNSKLDKSLVEESFKKLPSFTLHKPKRLHYRRIKVQVGGIDSQWQIDLIETQDLAGSHYGTRYIFTCIDVFSKKAWAICIKNKEAASCISAFKNILSASNRKPKFIYLDKGK
jgi:hypothetical protein